MCFESFCSQQILMYGRERSHNGGGLGECGRERLSGPATLIFFDVKHVGRKKNTNA